MPKPYETRAERNTRWIEEHCVIPAGPAKGKRVKLTNSEKETLHQIYDTSPPPDRVEETPIAAYLALLHLCGLEHGTEIATRFATDVFTVWEAASADVKGFLERKGEEIVCPELGLRFPRVA